MKAYFFILLLFVSGCANYTGTTRHAREEYYNGNYTEAAKLLEKGSQEEGVDQLLYLFDRATALHNAGEYKEAIKEFQKADKMAEIKDYTSLSTEAATLVTNDRILQYKGEDFEKVLINQYLALDYLLLQDFEAAQVENRRVNRKLYLMISEGKRKYKLNPMAKYLSGLIYESQGEFNDAFIDYKGVYDLKPDASYLKEDLVRTAWKAGLSESLEKWSSVFGFSKENLEKIKENASLPEVIVLVELGRSPEKKPNPQWKALPKYFPRPNPVQAVRVFVDGVDRGLSTELFDIENVAIENLDEKYGGILAKRLGGLVAKEVVAMKVDQKVSPLLGAALRMGFWAMDQADLRSWLTLPKEFQIFRLRVSPGKIYKFTFQPVGHAGENITLQETVEKVIEVPAGNKKMALQKFFIPLRML